MLPFLCLVAFAAADFPPPDSMFSVTNNQEWFAPPRNLHPNVLASKIPIPTNRWWSTLITTGQVDMESAKLRHTIQSETLRVWTNPYSVAVLPNGLQISFPYSTRAFGGQSGNSNSNRYYLHANLNDWTLSASELNAKPGRFQTTQWDDLGVTLRKETGAGSMETSLVSGMAYATATYANLTPQLSTDRAILSVNGAGHRDGQAYEGTKFVVALNSGHTWVLYASNNIRLVGRGTSKLEASGAFIGDVRVALTKSTGDVSVYDQYAGCVVKGGKVSVAESSYSFQWASQGNCDAGLLHFGLQHHADTMDRATASDVSLSHLESTTRGAMYPFVTKTNQWRLTEPNMIPVDFYPQTPPTADRVQRTQLLQRLTEDINAEWPMPLEGSYYFRGKAAQKYASLCLMAKDPVVVGSNTDLLATCQKKLEAALAPFIDNSWKYKLVYDNLYKGIVSEEGFEKRDLNADFGNTMYNDHHYHYGYWIAAAAIANVVHPSMPGLDALNRRTNFLIRDVANANDQDVNFPTFRMFDWFKGHSYSHGVTAFADGKDQESTSEDINFHYGLLLFGKATGQPEMERLGRLMLSVNARSIQTYFLMDSLNQVHPPTIRANKVPGIFFDNKVDYATWFSAEKHCIHGIQMLPVTPATEFVRTKRFVQEEWTEVLSSLPIVSQNMVSNPWLSLLYTNYAAVNPDVAMDKLQSATMDDGLSKSWALYMSASRYV